MAARPSSFSRPSDYCSVLSLTWLELVCAELVSQADINPWSLKYKIKILLFKMFSKCRMWHSSMRPISTHLKKCFLAHWWECDLGRFASFNSINTFWNDSGLRMSAFVTDEERQRTCICCSSEFFSISEIHRRIYFCARVHINALIDSQAYVSYTFKRQFPSPILYNRHE